jgi:hypothetical protein
MAQTLQALKAAIKSLIGLGFRKKLSVARQICLPKHWNRIWRMRND